MTGFQFLSTGEWPAGPANMRSVGAEALRALGLGYPDLVGAADVVILPAFGVTVAEMEDLRARGCVLVDTTCGSVLNVWKNVHIYAREGFTAVIHGKHYHEETKATASQALTHEGGHYLCVRDREEAEAVCAFIRGEQGAGELLARFAQDRDEAAEVRARGA